MTKIKKYELYALLFLTNAISMILELAAARILSPAIGSSNLVWTIIISIMLFANAVGNYAGGRLADKYSLDRMKNVLLLASGATCGAIAHINHSLLAVKGKTSDAYVVIVLLMIPCIAIGMLSPIINKAVLHDEEVGSKSGVIYTVITLGGLIGTLAGGLVLIPKIGCAAILYSIAVTFGVLGMMGAAIATDKKRLFAAGNAAVITLSIVSSVYTEKKETKVQVYDTDDGYVRIYNDDFEGEEIRVFDISGGWNSAMYEDEDKRNEIVFPYVKAYDKILEKKHNAFKYLMLGGAGYSYPRYLVSHYDDKKIDVIEIDKGITEVAKKHFGLQEFIDEYGTERLGLYNADGRQYLEKTDQKYDVILNDTFSGTTPARVLATKEAAQTIKNALEEDGVYASNLIGDFEGFRTKFLKSEIKTVASVFRYVWLIPSGGEDQNFVLIASDKDYGFEGMEFDLDGAVTFTDDYAPVEFLSS